MTASQSRWLWLLAGAVLIFGIVAIFDAMVPMGQRPLHEEPPSGMRFTVVEGTWHARESRDRARLAWRSKTLDAGKTFSSGNLPPDKPRRDPVSPPPPGLPTVTVGPGERLWGIAERALGAGERWQEIVALNPGLEPKKLREGQVLKLPAGARTNAGGGAGKKKPPAARLHIVSKGESLAVIAGRYYTDGQWRRIYDANRDQLENPARVPIGTRLRIPPQNGTDRL